VHRAKVAIKRIEKKTAKAILNSYYLAMIALI